MICETAYTPLYPINTDTVSKRKPKAYLAGPMRDIPLYNFPAFHSAALHLREVLGWDVISPAEVDLALGFDPSNDSFGLEDWYTAMRRDVQILLDPTVDRIVFLPGWSKSRGSAIERTVGEAIGLEMWFFTPGTDPTVTMFAHE